MPNEEEIKCRFDPVIAEKEITTEIITVFENLDGMADVIVSQKVDHFRTFTTGLEIGYEIGFVSLGVTYTEDKKLDIFYYIDQLYEDWDKGIVDNEELWINISTLIRALG